MRQSLAWLSMALLAAVLLCALGAAVRADRIVSDKALLLLSSTSHYDTPEHHLDLFDAGHKPCAFHTASEDKPWVRIDLGSTRTITAIEIVNRTDGWHGRIEGLEISVSDNGTDWQKVADAPGGKAEWLVEVPKVDGRPVKSRYLRIQMTNKECFHLSRVAVRGA